MDAIQIIADDDRATESLGHLGMLPFYVGVVDVAPPARVDGDAATAPAVAVNESGTL